MYVEFDRHSKILWLSFLFGKKSVLEKMSHVGRFIIGKLVTAKAIHVLQFQNVPVAMAVKKNKEVRWFGYYKCE